MATYINPAASFLTTYGNMGAIGIAFATNPLSPPTRIDFVPNTTLYNMATVTAAAQTWDWVPLPQPNPQAFVNAIEADATLTAVLYLLAPYYAAIRSYSDNPATIKSIWAQISPQLTSGQINAIQGYATANNMPLT